MSRGLQPMPVADAICQPGRQLWWTLNGEARPSSDFVSSLAKFKRVNFVRSPSAVEILKGLADGYEDFLIRLEKTIGPQTMPYPDMWFEGVCPYNGFVRAGGIPAIAAAIRAHQYDGVIEPTTGRPVYANAFTVFLLLADGSIVRQPFQVTAILNKTGAIQDVEATELNPETGRLDKDIPDDERWEWAITVTMAAMWAIGLMNCRNVKTEEVQRVPTKTKKQRRERGKNLLSYSTIVLPNHSCSANGNGQPHTPPALHTVRGHFASYGPENKLFGKYTGTYWRPWHVRGNPDHGVVVSDYKLDPGLRSPPDEKAPAPAGPGRSL